MAALHISLLLLLPLLTLLLFSGRRRKGNAAWKLPPGPNTLPIIGNLHQLGHSRLHQSLWELSKEHGPVMRLKLGHVPAVVVSSAGSAEQVLRTHDLECCSRPRTISNAKVSFGGSDVTFAPYGSHWRDLRKVCVVELFTTKKTTSFRPVREDEVQRTVESIRSRAPNSVVVNLSEELLSLAANITCRTAFGGRCHDGFHRITKECQEILATFFVADYFAMLGWVDVIRGTQARLQDVFLKLDVFCRRLIDDHLDPRRQQSDDGEDTLDALLRLQKDDNNITDAHIKGVLVDIFVAGSDTSASGVEWAMTELMRHPEKLRRARDEVRGCVGRKGKVEESDVHQLAYLKCVVKETLRLHPPAPLLVPRETMEHVKLDGYDVPPKTTIYVNAWAIGRDPNSWERPEEFEPERFMRSSVDTNGQDFKFIPFGEGRRICPAKNVGMATMELALANLLYSFDWDLPDGMKKEDISMDEAPGIAVHRKFPLVLVATKYGGIEVKDKSEC
ncbi:unnamed protein product [Musa acuminata subsp. burmannicoides]